MPPIVTNLLDAVPALKAGGLAVIPTDTIYGLVCSALDPAAVQHLYALRQRDPAKPCVILISQLDDLQRFDLTVSAIQQTTLATYWPGPVSVVLPCKSADWVYLHRGAMSLAFRMPADETLRTFLAQTGPLLAPSANPEGSQPATTVAEAQAYFGAQVAVYVDGGQRDGKPSRLVRLDARAAAETLRP